jgi:hypothetical protein
MAKMSLHIFAMGGFSHTMLSNRPKYWGSLCELCGSSERSERARGGGLILITLGVIFFRPESWNRESVNVCVFWFCLCGSVANSNLEIDS